VTKDEDGNKFTMSAVDLSASAYGAITDGSAGVDTASNAAAALTEVKAAITALAADRADVGANISRLSSTSEQLAVLKDNLSAANSRIKDVDVAEESTQFARYNILVQAGTAMLAQANATPQSALRLLS
jgi:flagellin